MGRDLHDLREYFTNMADVFRLYLVKELRRRDQGNWRKRGDIQKDGTFTGQP